ncbi:MAG: hypothetical protein WA742_14670 [Candidatus Cybelea sp.]
MLPSAASDHLRCCSPASGRQKRAQAVSAIADNSESETPPTVRNDVGTIVKGHPEVPIGPRAALF